MLTAEAEGFARDSFPRQSLGKGLGTASFIFRALKMNSGDSNPPATQIKKPVSDWLFDTSGGGRIRTFGTVSRSNS